MVGHISKCHSVILEPHEPVSLTLWSGDSRFENCKLPIIYLQGEMPNGGNKRRDKIKKKTSCVSAKLLIYNIRRKLHAATYINLLFEIL